MTDPNKPSNQIANSIREALHNNKLIDSQAPSAPLGDPEPLTGKEQAGIRLTWGIIVGIALFILVLIGVFTWGEYRYFASIGELLAKSTPGDEYSVLIDSLEAQQEKFRTFWFDTLQLILLNVLFPTLTALLGYVFGTSRANNDNTSKKEEL